MNGIITISIGAWSLEISLPQQSVTLFLILREYDLFSVKNNDFEITSMIGDGTGNICMCLECVCMCVCVHNKQTDRNREREIETERARDTMRKVHMESSAVVCVWESLCPIQTIQQHLDIIDGFFPPFKSIPFFSFEVLRLSR